MHARTQVLSPAREDLIRRTFEAVKGYPRVIFHMYNATSPCFRSVVFNNDKPQTVDLALRHVKIIRELVAESIANNEGTEWQFEYSPETFSQTEEDFAYDICNQVADCWFEGKDRSKEHPIIFNLPATVEISTPNHYADQVILPYSCRCHLFWGFKLNANLCFIVEQIEYFCRHLNDRASACISLHCHNDRGCATAATELGILAGAQRVEGCLFGNGERTGNVDIVQVALNLYTQGISPNLDFSDLYSIIEIVTSCNEIPVHQRHPYAGELVFCAFSGSHQDAIKKGFAAQKKRSDGIWEIPYLPIDPADLGCTYEAVIRVNSQSGKGGVSYIVQERLGLDMPRKMQIAFYQVIQSVADRTSKEMSQEDIERIFRTTFHYGEGYQGRFVLQDYTLGRSPNADGSLSVRSHNGSSGFAGGVSPSGIAQSNPNAKNRYLTAHILDGREEKTITGVGNGPISALLDAIKKEFDIDLSVREFTEAAIGQGTDVRAGSYVELINKAGEGSWGVGDSTDSTTAILQAVLSAVNRNVINQEELMDEVDGALASSDPSQSNGVPILTK